MRRLTAESSGLDGSMEPRTSSRAARAEGHLSPCVTVGSVPQPAVSRQARQKTRMMQDHPKCRHRTTGPLIRCVIVDDSRRFLRAVNDVLEFEGIVVAGLASTSAEAVRLASRHRPDVVLVDVSLGSESGFDLAQRLVVAATRAEQPTVILMSTYPEDDIRPMLKASPAAAFIPKVDISGAAIREVHQRHRQRASADE
jgi:CheY-like chemotaxis protein